MACLCVLLCNFLLPVTVSASTSTITNREVTTNDFPTVDPNYIYNQLFYMATHFQRRSAGLNINQGHDQFAAYWSQEMVRDLQGFAPTVRRDNFQFDGWKGTPNVVPGLNVEVSSDAKGFTQTKSGDALDVTYSEMTKMTLSIGPVTLQDKK